MCCLKEMTFNKPFLFCFNTAILDIRKEPINHFQVSMLPQCIAQRFSSIRHSCTTGLDKQRFQRKIVNIFLLINFDICFGCLKETSHLDISFEYPQHMFQLRNKKIIFCYTLITKARIFLLVDLQTLLL